jgi:hypothetical protein
MKIDAEDLILENKIGGTIYSEFFLRNENILGGLDKMGRMAQE